VQPPRKSSSFGPEAVNKEMSVALPAATTAFTSCAVCINTTKNVNIKTEKKSSRSLSKIK
jgi:hypothetical protein